MPIEIEKKYRLNQKQRLAIERRLRKVGAFKHEVEHEENTLYGGGRLDFGGCALRLRRVGRRALLTFKQRIPSNSPIKHQREEETEVADASKVDAILQSLGFRPALIYEKRRRRWKLGKAEVQEIARIEKKIGAEDLPAVRETYPTLTAKVGKKRNGIIEARFKKSKSSRKS